MSKNRRTQVMFHFELDRLLRGEMRMLAKSITLVESVLDNHRAKAQEVLESVLPHSGRSIRIGITGVPGVGKSTFIESFGLYLIGQGKKVAVLAVDPSSPVAGGSILGDKTRMELLSREPNAFIRPSPAGGALGGVAQKTRESLLLCEAAGYDVVLVETVGVGQSEYQVAGMVDFFMVLMLPNAGDELQGIKKGILELADAIVINKADGEAINMARRAKSHYISALHLLANSSFWQPQVKTCSALKNQDIDSVWDMVLDYEKQARSNGHFLRKRAKQNKEWMLNLIQEMLDLKLKQNARVQAAWPGIENEVLAGQKTPYAAAVSIMDLLDSS